MWYLLFIIGLAVGSFLNVLIYRLPRGQKVVRGQSRCPACGQNIAWYDLIPLVSWLVLGARCRHCRAPISRQYPLVELASGLIFVFGGSVFNIFLLEIFLVLLVIDCRYLLLPDGLLLAGIIGALALGWERVTQPGHLWAAAGLFLFFFLLWLYSRGYWLGLGDAKLAGLIGLAFGLNGGIIIIYSAIVLGALVGGLLIGLKRANLKSRLPLGSFIALTASLSLLGGSAIIDFDIAGYATKLFK